MEDVKDRFVKATLGSVKDIFATMIPLVLDMDAYQAENSVDAESVALNIVGKINIQGRISGSIYVSLPDYLAMEMASMLLMEEYDEINEDVEDAVGELNNMIAGGIKQSLSNFKDVFEIGIPEVTTDPSQFQEESSLNPIIVPVHTDSGLFLVSTYINTIESDCFA